MRVTTIQLINVSLEICGCVMCVIVGLCLFLSKHKISRSGKLYIQMLIFNAAALIGDIFAMVFRGNTTTFGWFGVRISNFLGFSCSYLLGVSFAHYLTVFIDEHVKVSKIPLQICRAFCAVFLLLVLATQFYPIFYSFDANNIYHRGSLFFLSHVDGFITEVISIWLLLRYRKALEAHEKAALWIYIILPLAALWVQAFIYGLAILNLVNTLSLVIVFLFLQAEQGQRMAQQEKLLTQSKISIMLSQIQPHFLYNSLNTIRYLCKSNPDLAQKSIEDFATYLRLNVDSLKRSTPIPFEKELEHIQIYLSLEKMRFDDRLNVCYDIKTTGFMVPALTVQPLVENAVKHGVSKKGAGGTVTISTREIENFVEITVKDDGVGFTTGEIPNDGITHVGIENVRERLYSMCKATLQIESTPNVGTSATIHIPKETQRYEHSTR